MLNVVSQLVDLCDAMADPVDDMIESFREAWDILDESAEVTSCSNINGNYQQIVFDDFCQVLPGGLLAFWVSGVFLTVLLLVLVSSSPSLPYMACTPVYDARTRH